MPWKARPLLRIGEPGRCCESVTGKPGLASGCVTGYTPMSGFLSLFGWNDSLVPDRHRKRFARNGELLSHCIFHGNMKYRHPHSPIDNASVATLPFGTRYNLAIQAACLRLVSLAGLDD